MKSEINLLPRSVILSRERSEYISGFTKLLQRIASLLMLLFIGEIAVYFAFATVKNNISNAARLQVETKEVSQEVEQTNKLITAFSQSVNDQIVWSLKVEDILRIAPVTVTINKISVNSEVNVLTFSGQATPQREAVELQKKLEKIVWVDRIEAPLQNFILGPNAGFSFSLFLKEKIK